RHDPRRRCSGGAHLVSQAGQLKQASARVVSAVFTVSVISLVGWTAAIPPTISRSRYGQLNTTAKSIVSGEVALSGDHVSSPRATTSARPARTEVIVVLS